MGTRLKLGDEKSLTFDIRGTREFSKIKVTLCADDTYNVTFYKFRKFEIVRQKADGDPEMMERDNVRDLIIDRRKTMSDDCNQSARQEQPPEGKLPDPTPEQEKCHHEKWRRTSSPGFGNCCIDLSFLPPIISQNRACTQAS